MLACTVVEGNVTYVEMDPHPSIKDTTDPRPTYKAIVAFHRACTHRDEPADGGLR
jgi:hypothetical protein